MTIGQWLRDAGHSIPGPDAILEARWMLEDVLSLSWAGIRLRFGDELDDLAHRQLSAFVEKRYQGTPLQYILNSADFMGHRFFVDERVLIPRQDTEILCELTIERARLGKPDVLDLCTGSGALGISVALACPNARISMADISPDALAVAEKNAKALGVQAAYYQGDFFDAVKDMRFDIIVCNPPYLTQEDMENLQTEVKREPDMALFGGEDGLTFYRRAAAQVRGHVKPGGWALFEVGAGQAQNIAKLLGETSTIHRDLNQIERVVALHI